MRVNLIDVGSIINIFLMLSSLAFLWYSLFYYSRQVMWSDPNNYFDELIHTSSSGHLHLVAFSSMLLFVSVFGYMALTDESDSIMIMMEMFFLLLMIAFEMFSIYSMYADEERMCLTVASYTYKGVVLPHKSVDNETDRILELTYGELNQAKWRCCGIFSWKDAESFRPKDCCRRGYRGVPGKGLCNENYGPYGKNCVEARTKIWILEVNRFTRIVIAIILTQFLGLMLCGMVLFVEMDNGNRPLPVAIRDILVNLRLKLRRRSTDRSGRT